MHFALVETEKIRTRGRDFNTGNKTEPGTQNMKQYQEDGENTSTPCTSKNIPMELKLKLMEAEKAKTPMRCN